MSYVIGLAVLIFIAVLVLRGVYSISQAVKIRVEGRSTICESEHQLYAKEILGDMDPLPVSEVVKLADSAADQYRLLDKYPKAWASAITEGYMEDLVLELDYFTTWATRTTRSNPSDATLDDLRKEDRCAYLQHLDLWARNEIPKLLDTNEQILSRIERDKNEQEVKLARAAKRIENSKESNGW